MLQHYYATEKPLPIGKALHRMLRAQDKAERDAIDAVAAQFWTTTDAGLVNERADQELTKASEQAETNRTIAIAREAARKAARAEHEQSTNRAHGVSGKVPEKSPKSGDYSANGAVPHKRDADAQVVDLYKDDSTNRATNRSTNDQPNHSHSQTPSEDKPPQDRCAAKRGTRLPLAWDPGETGMAFASAQGMTNGRAIGELEKFRDHWAAATGHTAMKLDWQAAWRMWVRRSVEFVPKGGKEPPELFEGVH